MQVYIKIKAKPEWTAVLSKNCTNINLLFHILSTFSEHHQSQNPHTDIEQTQ